MPLQPLNMSHGLRHDELCPIVALPCLSLCGMGRFPDLLHLLLQLAARRRLGLERRLHVVEAPLQRLDEKTISVVSRLEASIEECHRRRYERAEKHAPEGPDLSRQLPYAPQNLYCLPRRGGEDHRHGALEVAGHNLVNTIARVKPVTIIGGGQAKVSAPDAA